jgi:hypothetical protein
VETELNSSPQFYEKSLTNQKSGLYSSLRDLKIIQKQEFDKNVAPFSVDPKILNFKISEIKTDVAGFKEKLNFGKIRK